ncbi:hypothetical protein PHLGIDRAFT_20289 [Phlebiopsis gigantea 11061_1 CR5-6]|uniref:Acylphosphatase n=1 Tax=Phlebiopsis gigantea (strain 11061_1 CR5-6) TaxID=745531 RepID=A0A0C3S1P1_PHLG1|nr:hypothetical protein PHLGIDRAFT_20289 [Phlebiopsis gigantea 11061_1 CR5-6]
MPFNSIEFVVKGTVQGVGFRYFVRSMARSEGVVGWVKNDPEGDVVGMVQGEVGAVEKMKKHLAIGPLHADVTSMEVKSETSVDRLQFRSFDIAH